MWLEKDKIQVLDHALFKRKRDHFDRILTDIVHGGGEVQQAQIPVRCPKCQKNLVRRTLPYVELFVSACPDHHGAWMSPEVAGKLRQFIREQISEIGKRKHLLKLLNRIFWVLGAVAALSYGPKALNDLTLRLMNNMENAKISVQYWPLRDFRSLGTVPIKESVIDRQEELFYFEELSMVLEEGISNRMNMDGVLKSRRPAAEYEKLYELYQVRQIDFLQKLGQMIVPDRLRDFHASVVRATHDQVAFYGAFAQAKMEDPSVSLEKMLNHPALISSSRELHAADDLFRELYPNLDAKTQAAIEGRLRWFDIL